MLHLLVEIPKARGYSAIVSPERPSSSETVEPGRPSF
jgi:hypothetical protein